MHRFSLALVALVAAVAATACSKKGDAPAESSSTYGEPVGLRLSGNAGDPTYEIAFAVNKGKTPPAPDTMAGPVYVAAKSCPAVRDVTKNGQSLRVKVAIENGVVKTPAEMPDEPAAKCLLKGLEGKTVSKVDPSQKLDVLIELRAPETAS